jgi:iron complex outermembrane receptor protein
MNFGSGRKGLAALVSILGLILIPQAARAEASGEVSGVVIAADGVGLPGASIVFRNKGTGIVLKGITSDRGVYRMRNMAPGTYEIRVELSGFESKVEESIVVPPSAGITVDFVLKPATVHENVTVIGRVPRASFEASPARESTARDVGEAMAEVSGVDKIRKGGIATDVILRGFQSKDLNVLIDGERIHGACPNGMDPAAFHVDFAEVERIEIGKGPFDIQNQGGLGGVINIVTRQPSPGFHAYGSLAGGQQGYINPSLTASYGSERFSALAGLSFRRSDPYTDGTGRRFSEYGNFRPGLVDSDAFRVGTAWGKFSVRPRRNHQTWISYTRQQADHVLYPYLLMDAIYDDGDRVGFGYQIDSPGWVKSFRLQGYYTEVRHWMTDAFRTSSINMTRDFSMGTMAGTQTFGGKFEMIFSTIVVGAEAFRRQWDVTTQMAGAGYAPQYSIPDVKADTAGLYADYGLALLRRLRLNIGARVDVTKSSADPGKANIGLYYAYHTTRRTSVTDTYPSGSARLTFQVSRGLELNASVGHTVRVPDARERFFALKRMGTDWVGNPDLRPSRNTGINAGLSYHHAGLSFEFNVYGNQIEDFVTVAGKTRVNSVPGVMNKFARSYQNVDARIYGLDAHLSVSPVARIFLIGGVSALRGTQTPIPELGILSRNLSEMPPLKGRLGLRYDSGRIMGEVEGVFAGEQSRIDTDLREANTPGYGLLNLKAGFNFRGYTLRVGLDNVFDKHYFEYLSYQRDPFRSNLRVMEPGRNIYVSLSFSY